MKNILERLKAGEVLVNDGAMGTQLMEMGLGAGECPELWNIKFPQKIAQLHKDYINSGCDIIVTNTFGANRIKLEKAGPQKDINEINKRAVGIAKDASGGRVYVFGDIGPTGELLEPLGGISEKEAEDCFLEQIEILKQAGVDGLIFETFSDLKELTIATEAAANFNLPKIATMTFQRAKDGFRTVMGIAPQDLFRINCDIFGANCSLGTKDMIELAAYFRSIKKDKILIMQPNAGMPVLKNNETTYPETPDDFKAFAEKALKIGINIIGGCCGTTPAHIKAIRDAVNKGRDKK